LTSSGESIKRDGMVRNYFLLFVAADNAVKNNSKNKKHVTLRVEAYRGSCAQPHSDFYKKKEEQGIKEKKEKRCITAPAVCYSGTKKMKTTKNQEN
jgi:hypothetical protein